MIKILVFLAILSILVLVHEFGHFIIGRLAGIGILEFALGLPFTKPLVSKRLKNGMKLSLYPILFGGFVSLKGEEQESDSNKTNKSSNPNKEEDEQKITGEFFYKTPVKTRVAVVVAGVVMNLILAVVALYAFLILSGFHVFLPKIVDYRFLSPHSSQVVVLDVASPSPAKEAGFKPGDMVLSVNGEKLMHTKDFSSYVKARSGRPTVIILSDSTFTKSRAVTIVPRVNPPEGQGSLGVVIGEGVVINFLSARDKIFSGLTYTADMLFYSIKAMQSLISASVTQKTVGPLAEGVSGPVGVYNIVGDIVDVGGAQSVAALINLLGVMSLSLAFMNILPFPALDGGKLAFLLVEGVTGRKLSAKHENWVNQIGFAFLFGLIILITFSDVGKFLRK